MLTNFYPGIIGLATLRDIGETATNICIFYLFITVLKAGNRTEDLLHVVKALLKSTNTLNTARVLTGTQGCSVK